ncbi:MAG: hypothetical protein Q9190_000251 [Brigantiaea leucoxantha]
MSLADYLAKNYLTADSKAEHKSKKRKRKEGQQQGLVIADDDALGWISNGKTTENDEGPLTVLQNSAEFRKTKKNNWQTIGAPAPSSAEQATADAIIASVSKESAALAAADEDDAADNLPIISSSVPQMESGAHAGLQTASQVASQLKQEQISELQRFQRDGDEHSGRGTETIYRDASGRIINVAMKRAEARKKAEEDAAKQAADLEAQRGDVQRLESERRRQQLADAKLMTVSRYADDEQMNEELRERERWNDPAAQFLAKKGTGKKSVSGRPLYKGAFAPNRYGIRPGHRWDGVDRGSAFEKEFFAAKNRRKDLKELDYAWQMDE